MTTTRALAAALSILSAAASPALAGDAAPAPSGPAVAAAGRTAPSPQVENLGLIHFPNSGSAAAQEPFLRGALLLHSFEDEDAAAAFREAQAADPGFALAYWGEAMTHHHPLWQEEDVAAARAILARLAPTPEARQARARTSSERGLLTAVEILYGEGPRPRQRQAYADALGLLSRRHPEDLEIASFHALAILGTTFGVRDIPTYMRAAAVAEEVYAKNPRHPGALHYLIHAYDDPVHAPLGLRQARVYGSIAPAAAHALHMPSHIHFALGMWDESAAANEASSAAADARRARLNLGVDARGYHSLQWLAYTYLQQGRAAEARALLQQMAKDTEATGSRRARYHLAVMKAAHVVATGDGTAGAEHPLEVETGDLVLTASAADHLVEGLAALGRDDLDGARARLALMREQYGRVSASDAEAVHAGCAPAASPYASTDPPGRQAARIMAEELAAMILLAEGRTDAALAGLREAADLEDGLGFDFGPPLVVKPAHELLGEVLLDLGRADEALESFGAALARAPRRSIALLGQARAAAGTGDAALAREIYLDLGSTLHRADGGSPLAEAARQGLAAHPAPVARGE